ncbi:hypothetical protein G134_1546 [Lactobacillus delbrueckii subsp. lactis CRL581]|nr:hypothetical protein G134_1546 [Lactobacillus delbrueckii subsp. lactis CRL581]
MQVFCQFHFILLAFLIKSRETCLLILISFPNILNFILPLLRYY